jgi:hypothetical protein
LQGAARDRTFDAGCGDIRIVTPIDGRPGIA